MKQAFQDVRTLLVGYGVLLGVAGGAVAEEETYHFGVSDQRSNVTFESRTDFETILGSTNKLRGKVKVDFDRRVGKVSLQVPVASLRTGIEMRDEHLSSPMWLDAKKYPFIAFRSTSVTPDKGDRWLVRGKFTLHGITKSVAAYADVRRIPQRLAKKAGLESGKWIKVKTYFSVQLSDFGVEIPKMAAAKVSDVWKVRVTAFATTEPPLLAQNPRRTGGKAAVNPCDPCNPCGGKQAAANPCNPCNPCGGKQATNPCNPCNPCGKGTKKASYTR